MGTEASRLNSEIQRYIEKYAWLLVLIYRKDPFWYVLKLMIQRIIYQLEIAQSPAIAR